MNKQDCTDVFARLSDYLDRDLSNESCEEMERHIAGCAPCVQFVESLKKSIDLTRSFEVDDEVPPMPEELKGKLRRAFDAARVSKPQP